MFQHSALPSYAPTRALPSARPTRLSGLWHGQPCVFRSFAKLKSAHVRFAQDGEMHRSIYDFARLCSCISDTPEITLLRDEQLTPILCPEVLENVYKVPSCI